MRVHISLDRDKLVWAWLFEIQKTARPKLGRPQNRVWLHSSDPCYLRRCAVCICHHQWEQSGKLLTFGFLPIQPN
jgi:hypothetical protein